MMKTLPLLAITAFHNHFTHGWAPNQFQYSRPTSVALKATSQKAITFVCRDEETARGKVDAALLSNKLVELGALSVTCSERAPNETPTSPTQASYLDSLLVSVYIG